MAQQRKIQESEFDVNDPRCIRCDGANLTKIGSRDGKQRYRCEDCRRHFNGELYVKTPEFDLKNPKCVHCESPKIVSHGHDSRTNRRKYKCRDCHKIFQGELYTLVLAHREFDTTDPKCVFCDSQNLAKHGKFRYRQKYFCKDCERHFGGEVTELKAKRPKFNLLDPKCVYCSSKEINKKGACDRTNKQRYKCKKCCKVFVGELYVKTERPLAFNGASCPACHSRKLRKNGKEPRNNKQKYLCKNCGKTFTENPKFASSRYILPKDITPELMFDYDIWDLQIFGLDIPSNGNYSVTFSNIKPEWLKNAAKQWIRFKASCDVASTLNIKVVSIRHFSRCIIDYFPDINPQDINRDLIVQYIAYLSSLGLSPQTRISRIGHIKHFIEDCGRFNWIDVTKEQLVYKEDYPKLSKPLPRYIPDNVLHEIKNNYHLLSQPIVCAVEVLLGTGVRTSELVELKINCIEQDNSGAYWIKIYQRKMKKEISLIISKELASLIHQQQEYIREHLGTNFKYLFCGTKNRSDITEYKTREDWSNRSLKPITYFEPAERKLDGNTLRCYLHRFAAEINIFDESGDVFPLGRLHQFRHTHGTELINNGVPQHIVQKRLGHDSARMTNVYAHIHDKTMKQEMEKFWDGRVFNNQGEVVVSANPELDTAEMQWIKKNMKAQTLPDGFCGLPVTQSCPVQGSPCLTCSHLRTTMDFLDVHKKRLEETEKLIENARANGWNRQVETNLPIADNLRKIIRGLEQQEVVYGDESFPEQEGGKESA